MIAPLRLSRCIAAVARLDLSAEKSFDGFGDTEMAIGFSLLNLAIGDQAPREALPPLTLAGRSRPMSRPMFTGVPVPSLLFRVRF